MADVDELVAYMRNVQLAERELRDIGAVWQLIEASAEIGCPEEVAPILPTLTDTRERFQQLSGRLVSLMAGGQVDALGANLGARAQCVIDILIRNLYERTADVGFLATDDDVRSFCAQGGTQGDGGAALRQRLADYQAKYTVYDDIVLLAPDGRLLLRLDDRDPAPGDPLDGVQAEPLLARALGATGWQQRYGSSPLAARRGDAALLFAHRIVGPQGGNVGVLVLRFRFDDEMERIFGGVDDGLRNATLLLIDEQQRVVACSDPDHVPLGARLRPPQGQGLQALAFAGRDYLAVCRAGQAYQGYGGPGWRAVAMVSLLAAFHQTLSDDQQAVPLDSSELLGVQREADTINRELRRVVWNGRLNAVGQRADLARFKAVLRQVTQAGSRTRERLKQALHDLSVAALGRTREQALQLSRLAADILDRNLYERANDCRWWALSPVLRQGLAELAQATGGAGGDAAPATGTAGSAMAAVLEHINSLYTVYSRLVVFDAQGRICATSRDEAGSLVGGSVPAQWLAAVRGLQHAQQYAVSPFEDTALHDQGPTWVYLAALRAPATAAGSGQSVLGGIAIVFNAATELRAMLHEVLAGQEGCAAFVDAQGRVLVATDEALAASLVQAGQGAVAGAGAGTQVLQCQGHYFLMTMAPAQGYREFKRSDGYDHGVRTLLALRVGLVERRGLQYADAHLRPRHNASGAVADMEAAVFQVAYGRYALPAGLVVDAVPLHRLAPVASSDPTWLGLMPVGDLAAGGGADRVVRVVCARRLFGVHYQAREGDGVVLLLQRPTRPGEIALGLRVDDVLTVVDVPAHSLMPAPFALGSGANRVSALIDCQAHYPDHDEQVLVQLLDGQALLAELSRHLPPLAEVAQAA